MTFSSPPPPASPAVTPARAGIDGLLHSSSGGQENPAHRGLHPGWLVMPYLLAVAVGAASAWVVLRGMTWSSFRVQAGQWTGSTLAGSPQADMYTRARVALEGLLALGRSETIYFVADHDDQGRRLKSRCNYLVRGYPPDARWWSVTAYADDFYLFDAPNHQYSLNASTARLDAQGQFALSTGPLAREGVHWLPTPGDRHVVLTLRLYNPSEALQQSPASLRPPSITRSGACT